MKSIKYTLIENTKKGKFKDNYKYFIISSLFFLILFFYYNSNSFNYHIHFKSNLIKENFFVIDTNNLRKVHSHMYGFSISKEGILTDNYYKKIKNYKDPEPDGIYIMVRKNNNEIKINQDFYGSIGLYLYQNKDTGYFAISNSFLLLEEYLVGKENFTLNKDFADNFIVAGLCTPSINETLVKEIAKLPANIYISINIEKKSFNFYYIDYKENTIPLYSEEGLKIIDKWVDKWGYIIRSLSKQTNNICADLSGGFDTRMLLAILLNSGVKLKDISIRSKTDKFNGHDEDLIIAKNISSFFGLKLNENKLDETGKFFNVKDSIFCTIYPKMGFHKEFYFKKKFFRKPRFHFSGSGGGLIRGYPGKTIKEYIERLSLNSRKIKQHQKEFYNSTMRLCQRSLEFLQQRKIYKNDYEISADFYYRGRARSHFGTAAYESFIANIFYFEPLIDSDIKKIKFDIIDSLPHDIPAYIYVRFANDLINFPFQGNRFLKIESIKRAEKINKELGHYKKKYNYKKNFYIDKKRKYPVSNSKDLIYNGDAIDYIKEIVKTNKIYFYIQKIYDDSVYKWSVESINKNGYFPYRYIYSLLAIAKTLEDISANQAKLRLIPNIYKEEKKYLLFNFN